MSRLYKQNSNPLKHNCNQIGYGGSVPYLYYKTNNGVVDGSNRMHIQLYFRCDTCGKEVLAAMIHCDSNSKLYDTRTNSRATEM